MSGLVGWTIDRADLAVLLPDVLPGLAGVGGFVDAVAGLDVAADVGLAGADVDDVGIGRGDGEGADGLGGLVVEDRLPVDAAVAGFPDAARGNGGVIGERIAGHTHRTRHPAAGGWADAAIIDRLEFRRTAVRPFRLAVREGFRKDENGQGEEEQSGRGGKPGTQLHGAVVPGWCLWGHPTGQPRALPGL